MKNLAALLLLAVLITSCAHHEQHPRQQRITSLPHLNPNTMPRSHPPGTLPSSPDLHTTPTKDVPAPGFLLGALGLWWWARRLRAER